MDNTKPSPPGLLMDDDHIDETNIYLYDQLMVQRLSENAKLPFLAKSESAGFDLYSAYDYEIKPRSHIVVYTDIVICLPPGTYGRIAPRSGLAVKYGIDVGAGVIDRDYTGNIGVVLFNHSDNLFKIQKGDRIAQLIIEMIDMLRTVREVNFLYTTPDELNDDSDPNKRGTNGFGSTGQ